MKRKTEIILQNNKVIVKILKDNPFQFYSVVVNIVYYKLYYYKFIIILV